MSISQALGNFAGEEIALCLIAKRRQNAVEQGDVYFLSLPGRSTLVKGGEDSLRRHRAGEDIGQRGSDLERWTVRLTGQAHPPPFSLHYRIVSRSLPEGSAVSVSGDRAIDDLGPSRANRLVAKTQTV